MPDRIIRDELLESERWLSLPDNAPRVCFLACLLTADTFGNLDGSPGRLKRLWRDYTDDTPEAIEAVLKQLIAADLIRPYVNENHSY